MSIFIIFIIKIVTVNNYENNIYSYYSNNYNKYNFSLTGKISSHRNSIYRCYFRDLLRMVGKNSYILSECALSRRRIGPRGLPREALGDPPLDGIDHRLVFSRAYTIHPSSFITAQREQTFYLY